MIEKIVLEAIRGATEKIEILLDRNKRLSLIYGENGTGKSSIIDAIELVCKSRFGSISFLPGNSKAEFVSIGRVPTDVRSEIVIDQHSYIATLDSISSIQSSYERENSSSLISVLRRQAILNLVTAAPADRYKEIKRFINIDNSRQSEDSLNSLLKKFAQKQEESSCAVNRAREKLMLYIPKEQINNWENYVDNLIKVPIEDKEIEAKGVKEILDKFNHAKIMRKLISDSEKKLDESKKELDKLNLEFAKNINAEADSILNILELAQTYLTEYPQADQCPVCKAPIESSVLSQEINNRIAGMKNIKSQREQIKKAKRKNEELQNLIEQNQKDFFQFGSELYLLGRQSLLPLITDFDFKTPIEEGKPIENNEVVRFFLKLEEIEPKLLELQRKVNEETQNYTSVKIEYQEYQAKGKEATYYALLRKEAQRIYDKLVLLRKDQEKQVLSSIESSVNELYQQIHPQENISFSGFEVSEKQKGSVQLCCYFEGIESISSFKYLSESHLDTLGICLFIALAKNSGKTILIFDDILTSVDRPHLQRIASLLYGLLQENLFQQIIVTTHIKDWLNFYKNSRLPVYQVNLVELKKWTKQAGIKLVKSNPTLKILKNLAESEDRDLQTLASKASIFLESICDILVDIYQCPVPRRELTFGDYSSAFNNNLINQMIVNENIYVGKELQSLLQRRTIRNKVGSHFARIDSIPDNEIESFIKDVITFGEHIICPRCGCLPIKDGFSFWKCQCKQDPYTLKPYKRP